MYRLRIIVLGLTAAFALTVAMSATSAGAAVLPEFSPAGGAASLTAGTGEFTSSAASWKCAELGSGKLTEENKRLGFYTFDYLTCKATVLGISIGCKSLGDGFKNASNPAEGGTILNYGTWHLVRGRGGSPIALFLLLLKETHLECSNAGLTITALILVRGSVCGLISPLKTKTTKFEIKIETTAAGGTNQKVTEFENDGGTLVKCGVESSTNGGAFEATGENSTAASMTTTNSTEIIES